MNENLTSDEMALISVFAKRIADGAAPLLTVGELKRESTISDAQARATVETLSARGWLFIASTVNWDDQTQCILLGPGLERAHAMAAQMQQSRGAPKSQSNQRE